MYIVAYRLITLLNDSEYDSTDAHIASELLRMIKDIDKIPIDIVAKKCSVSKSTVSKFVKKLGFDDYKEFRENAQNEKKHSEYHKFEQKITSDEKLESAGVHQYLEVLKNDIDHLLDGISMIQIRKLAEAIHRFNKVAVFGSMYSQTAAMDLMYKIGAEGKYIKTNIDDRKQDCYIKNADEDTLIIIFSNSGQYIYENGLIPNDQSRSFVRNTKGKLAIITSNPEAAGDTSITYPVLYRFTSNVQNHEVIDRIIINLITDEYKKIAKNSI